MGFHPGNGQPLLKVVPISTIEKCSFVFEHERMENPVPGPVSTARRPNFQIDQVYEREESWALNKLDADRWKE